MPNTQQPRDNQTSTQYAEPLHSVKVRSDRERKKFFLDLNENDRGIFLRIKEVSDNGRQNFIMVPADTIEAFTLAVQEILNEFDKQ